MTKLKILALDPATKCGWATSGASGVWDLRVKKDESSGMRLIRLRAKLDDVHKLVGIDLLVFEASRNMKYGQAVKIAAQLQGVIELWCTDNQIEYAAFSPAQIKKHATGKGNADKQAMIAAAKKKWIDREITDDNEADALWLLDLATSEYNQ